jgi:hypothetical protein
MGKGVMAEISRDFAGEAFTARTRSRTEISPEVDDGDVSW